MTSSATKDDTPPTAPASDIKALGPGGLEALVAEMGEPRFRAGQILTWLHSRGAASFGEMTDLPAALRERLGERFRVGRASVERVRHSADGSRKYLVAMADRQAVEAVGLPSGGRLTVCFSSQAGCAMGCSFCATGKGGLVRSLNAGEMVDQVRLVGEDFGRRVTNAVAMGQGEPFADYDTLMDALRLMNHPKGLGIGARHITVSTCGIVPRIRRFGEEPEQFTLAVSLHSAVQSTRDALMPAMKTYPLAALRSALADYAEKSGRRPSLEYALLAGVNDSAGELGALLSFCKGLLCHVNLIPVNEVAETGFAAAPSERVRAFLRALAAAGVEASERTSRGADIEAACGQLRAGRAPRP